MNERFRAIPSMDHLLDLPGVRALSAATSRAFVRDTLRSVVTELRAELRTGALAVNGQIEQVIEARLQARLAAAQLPRLRPVINATGVVLHTNLGRAPLAAEAITALTEIARSYSNLEYDLTEGRRGQRDAHCEELLCELTGAESAVVVNNNAAAVLLVLNELAAGGEVIVSRGELVEIGGGFRIPDVMTRSGAILREVGTTNKTRLSDYEAAINAHTRALLRVHPSNFQITGFTAKPSLAELVTLARQYQLPCLEDLGSGCLLEARLLNLGAEPTVQSSVQAGVSVITFSGDKLLGGPQAGIIVGERELLSRIRRNPLMRALRVDKLTYAALEATLKLYREGRARRALPVLAMLNASVEELAARATRLIAAVPPKVKRTRSLLPRQLGPLTLSVGRSSSVAGGGSAPEQRLAAAPLQITHAALSASAVEAWLRRQNPAIIGRIEQAQVLLDLRTVRPAEEASLLTALAALAEVVPVAGET